jgi:hypothetical protein
MLPDPNKTIHAIKFYAVEVAATIVFLAWLGTTVWHEVHRLYLLALSP